MPDKCPTCNRKIPKRVYTITGIFQNLGKIHNSSDLIKSKKYIYSVLDQLGATDDKKELIHQRIENDIDHSRDDVFNIINEILILARNDLVHKGHPLWQFIIDNYLNTGINESFSDFYKKYVAYIDINGYTGFSSQLVSRLLNAINVKSKTKRVGNSSCMYIKISAEELLKKINNLGIIHNTESDTDSVSSST